MKRIFVVFTVAMTIMIGLVKPAYANNKYSKEFLSKCSEETMKVYEDIRIKEGWDAEMVELLYTFKGTYIEGKSICYNPNTDTYMNGSAKYTLDYFDYGIAQISFLARKL